MIIKNSVSELGPFLDQHLAWALQHAERLVPVAEEVLREDDDVSGFSAISGVLSVRQSRGNDRAPRYQNISLLKRYKRLIKNATILGLLKRGVNDLKLLSG